MKPVATFLAIAFTLPWLLWLLRLGTGVDVIAPGGMLSVGIATFVTARRFHLNDTGLTVRPLRTTVSRSAAALGGMLVLAAAAVLIGAAAGVHRLDLTGFSGLHQVFGPGPGAFVTAIAQNTALFVVLLPLAFCEEWGWRGFLLPRLLPLGRHVALPVSSLIWGLWHLPGYVGSNARPAFLAFLVFTVLFGVLLGELRLRTGSVWPGTVAHAANNTLVIGFVNVAFTDSATLAAPDPWSLGLSGWPGWVAMAAVIVALTRIRAKAAV